MRSATRKNIADYASGQELFRQLIWFRPTGMMNVTVTIKSTNQFIRDTFRLMNCKSYFSFLPV